MRASVGGVIFGMDCTLVAAGCRGLEPSSGCFSSGLDISNCCNSLPRKDLESGGVVRDLILKELSEILVWDVAYASRNTNKIAHELAQFARASPEPHPWFGAEVPFWFREMTQE
ncbi:hypothetical protein ACS0TY_031043 [Phlomoides rotata]